MTNKYKISDLAKDFNLKSKDLLVLVNEITGTEKKSGAALNEDEIGLVFTRITADNQVKSFDAYFATGEESREKAKKAREEEKNKKLAEQMAILEQLKAAAAAQNGEVVPEKKKEEAPKKAEAKPQPKKEEKKPAEKKEEPKKAPKHAEEKATKSTET